MANESEGGGKGIDPKVVEGVAKEMAAVKSAARDAAAAFQQQLDIIVQMRDAMAEVAKNMGEVSDKQGALSPEKLSSVAKELERLKNESSASGKSMGMMAKLLQSKWVPAAGAVQGALSGMIQGFRSSFAVLKGLGGVLSSVTGLVFGVGKAILSIPFKMFDVLYEGAEKAAAAGVEIRRAYEEIREEFGSLKSAASSSIIESSKSLGGFKDAGLSAYSVFGNTAERIRFMTEMAKGMGAQFNNFTNEMRANGGALAIYQKGLGITASDMEGVAQTAARMGTSMSSVLLDTTKQAMGMAKAFGVNAKVVSRDMGRAMKDLANFGHLSTKEMGLAAAYANKLGISVEKLTGMMSATQTFDQAAEGMSKLNEQYGTNIDATKVMMAQSPAEKFAIIAKGFRDAGKDLTKLTYQDKAFIKAQTGMEDSVLNAMIANKDAGAMYDKMSQQADKNADKTMDQAKAMKELADSVKRVVAEPPGGKGFFGKIMEGISKGVQSSPEFIRLMNNIASSFSAAARFGRQLGRMFVEFFPGVKQMFGGLADMFDPANFRAMFKDVVGAFDILKKGGPTAVGDFMEQIKKVFEKFLGKGSKGGGEFLDGLNKFGDAFLSIIEETGKWLYEKLKPPVTKMIQGLVKLVIEAVKNIPGETLGNLGMAFGAFMIGPALLRGAMGAVSGGIVNKMGKLFAASKGAPAAGAALEQAGKVAESAKDVDKSLSKVEPKGMTSKLFGMAGLIAVGLFAVWGAMKLFKDVPIKDVLVAGAALQIGMLTIAEAAGIAFLINKTLGKVQPAAVVNGLKSVGAVILAMAAAAGILYLAFGATKIDIGKLSSIVVMMSEMGNVFLKASVIAIAAAGIGAAMIASLGTGAAAVAAGLATMTSVVAVMATTVVGIMKSLSEIKEDPSAVKAKSEAFAAVMNAVANMMGQIANVLSSLDFGILDSVFGNQKGKIDGAQRLIKTLIDGEKGDGKGGIRGTIDTIILGMKEIPDEKVKAAATFALVLNSIGNLVSSLVGPAAKIIDSCISWSQSAREDESKIDAAMSQVSSFIRTVMNGIKGKNGLIASITSSISELSGIEGIEKKGPVVANIFSAIGGMMSAIIPNFSSFQRTFKSETSALGMGGKSESSGVSPQVIGSAMNYVTAVLRAMGEELPSLVTSITGNFMSMAQKLKPSEMKRLTVIGDVMKVISSLISAFAGFGANRGGNVDMSKLEEVKGTVNVTIGAVPDLTMLMQKFGAGLPALFKTVVGLTSIIPDNVKNFGSKISTVAKVLESIGNILGQLKVPVDANAPDNIVTNIMYMRETLRKLQEDKTGLPKMLEYVKNIGNAVDAESRRDMLATVRQVQDIVAAVQKMDNALATLDGVNIGARLKKIDENFTLGAGGAYTVKSKEVVLNVSFQITMTASDVEKAIVFRKDSVVRDRINLALGGEKNPASLNVNTPNPQLTTSKVT